MSACFSSDVWIGLFNTFINLFLPVFLGVIAVTFLVSLPHIFSVKHREAGHYILVLGFVALGGTIGVLAGTSRTPVVANVIPALLTFVSAALVYIFSKETLNSLRTIVPICILGMVLANLLFTFVGTTLRTNFEKKTAEVNRYNYILDEVNKLQAELVVGAVKNGSQLVLDQPECKSK